MRPSALLNVLVCGAGVDVRVGRVLAGGFDLLWDTPPELVGRGSGCVDQAIHSFHALLVEDYACFHFYALVYST